MDLGIPGGCCRRQTMVEERGMKEQGWTWGFLEVAAADRARWRSLVDAICANLSK